MTLMPFCRTSAGMRPRAELTRFWTSTAARSMFRSTLNETVRVQKPLLVDDEVMYVRPSTPLMACSSGVVTALSSVCALAPT